MKRAFLTNSRKFTNKLNASFASAFAAKTTCTETSFSTLAKHKKPPNDYEKTNHFLVASGAIGFAGIMLNKRLRENLKQTTKGSGKINEEQPYSNDNALLKKYFFNKVKYCHDDAEPEKIEQIQATFSNFFDNINDKPLIKEVMQISAAQDRIDTIYLIGKTDKELAGYYDTESHNIFIFDINNRNTDKILATFVHECGHSVQTIFSEICSNYENPLENGSLVASFNEDYFHSQDLSVKKKLNDSLFDYHAQNHSYEIHSRMLEELLINTPQTEKIFQNTTSEMVKIHENLKSSLQKEPSSHSEKVSANRDEQHIFINR